VFGALVVLAINVAMLLVGGSLTLITQRTLARRRARSPAGSGTGAMPAGGS